MIATEPQRASRVLVTGASGVLGHAIVERLAGAEVACGVGRGWMLSVPTGGRVVRLDLSRNRLGLDAASYGKLARWTDTIVHAAALTEWGLPDESYESINVEGTARVVALAEAAGASLVFVSSAFAPAMVSARWRLHDDNVMRGYLASKLAAEEVVRRCGEPASIIRCTQVLGDETTGMTARKQVVQFVSEWIMRGRLPFFPVPAGTRMDLLPVSSVASAVAALVVHGADGGEYWVTAGPRALAVEEIIAICVETGVARGFRTRAIAPVDPRGIDFSQLEVVPVAAAMLRMLADSAEVIAAMGGVLPTSMDELAEKFAVRFPDIAASYRRTLNYWSAAPVR